MSYVASGLAHSSSIEYTCREKTAEIVEHLPKGKFEDGLSFPARPADLRSLPTPDFVPLETMSKAIDSIIDVLKDEKNKIIGVHGSGGIGKTTLMKQVVKQVGREIHFDKVLLVRVTQTPNLTRIQDEIAKLLGFQIEGDVEYQRAATLSQRLKHWPMILIILDNLWEKMDLATVGIPYGEEHKEVVRQCGKLPNAIVIIGGALRNKPIKEWNDAIKKERDSEEAKSCLQFSCLFPAYYHVSMEEFVIHGLVDRLFPGAESLEEVWNKMDSIVAELKSFNLLLVDDKESYYRIHDDTRKVIKFIANNLMAEAGLRKGWPEEEDLRECRKLSLMDSNVTTLHVQPECLFGDWEVEGTTNQQNEGFSEVASLTHLTVLYIHVKNTNVLSIDFDGPWRNLKRFRIFINDDYWDMSSTKSMHLKNLTNPLTNWVKLLLEKTDYLTFTHSKNLEDIGKLDVQCLTRWISFHLRACSINRVFSSGLYAIVSNLKDLHVEYSYSLKEVFYLEDIEEERSGLTRLRELIPVGLPKLMSIWKGHQEELFHICSSAAPPVFYGNHKIPQLENLKTMKVKDCGKLRNIFSKTLAQKLHTLEHLAILKCGSLEEIVSNDNAEVGGLNLLEELTVDGCNQVERIITASGEVRESECKNMLPKLKILALNDLPKLETVCHGELLFRWPALQELHALNCPKLKKLPLDSRSAPKMRKLRGQSSWFEDLQLKDEYAKTRLQPLLTEE
ncbi:hypothetical protein EZV62_009100 [Acer yangbiense]|uniref:Uncharacterized protein n=1 Tax=Acer yangbiense TaxID=1000413 RepID=A0A5C7IFN0_9ROSI|nr:hypothetical protein EZV62_009100 [Acer yangbiense]